jgi:hypothetical protein
MESNEQQRNVEQQREDRLASEAKAEAFRNKQWANQLSQQALANSRADKAWERDEARYQTGQGRLDKADEDAVAAAKAAAEKYRTEWAFKLSEADYSKSRDVVADLKVARDEHTKAVQQMFDNDVTLHGVEIANANRARNDAQFENTVKRQGVTDDQWNQLQKFKVDVFEAGEARADQEFEFKVGRTTVADVAAALALEVAAAERLYGREEDAKDRVQWQKNMDLQIEKFKNTLTQQGLTQENWEKAFTRQGEQQDLAQENVMFGRKIKMLELSEDLTKAFSGKGGSTKGAKAPSAEDMNAATINIRSELGGKQGIDNLGKADKEFFETVMADPAAAHGIYAFVQTQRVKEGNNINILDLPKYINLAGMIEAKGDPEAASRLRSEILEGDININNVDSLFDGIKAVSEYKPAEVVWGVLKAPKKSQDHSADLKLFSDAIQNRAMSSFNNMDKSDPNYDLLKNAIDELDSDKPIVKSRGFDTLFDIMGVELLEEMGMEDNPAFSYKMREYKAREAALRQERMIRLQETSKGPEGMSMPGLGEESSGMPDRSVQEFTREEAETFMGANPDFRGQLRVDGQLMSNEGDGPSRTAPALGSAVIQDTPPEVPAEVKEAVEAIVTTGNQDDIEQALAEITAEFGEDMASILFKGYVPPSMGATELNTPAIREAVANVPAEVKEAIESVITQGDEAEVEQAKQEIADEFGEEVAESLFWDALKRRPGNRTQDIPGFGNN